MNIQNTATTTESITRKIGQNRGKPRLWIEGDALKRAGFQHGDKWVLVPVIGGFDIARVHTDESKLDGRRVRKIAGTAARPIVDIIGASLGGYVGEASKVTLTFTPGLGHIYVRD